jgi:hypothetical protein
LGAGAKDTTGVVQSESVFSFFLALRLAWLQVAPLAGARQRLLDVLARAMFDVEIVRMM